MQMPVLRSLLAAMIALVCIASSTFAAAEHGRAAKVDTSNPYGAYLKLDGRWYGVTSDRQWEVDLVGLAAFVDDTTATSCRRANGSFPSLGDGWIFGVGSPMSFMGARTTGEVIRVSKTHPSVPAVIELASLDGDVQCTGQVAAPVLTPPPEAALFANGFE